MIGLTQTVDLKPSVDLASGVIRIEEITTSPDLFNPRELFRQHAVTVVQTRDKIVRDALIALGWRPPLEQAEAPDFDVRKSVRAHDPLTSITAAEGAAPAAKRHCMAILSALIDKDLTVREIATHIGITHVQVARRMPDMQRAGKVVVVQTPSGEDLERGGCRVWRRVA